MVRRGIHRRLERPKARVSSSRGSDAKSAHPACLYGTRRILPRVRREVVVGCDTRSVFSPADRFATWQIPDGPRDLRGVAAMPSTPRRCLVDAVIRHCYWRARHGLPHAPLKIASTIIGNTLAVRGGNFQWAETVDQGDSPPSSG